MCRVELGVSKPQTALFLLRSSNSSAFCVGAERRGTLTHIHSGVSNLNLLSWGALRGCGLCFTVEEWGTQRQKVQQRHCFAAWCAGSPFETGLTTIAQDPVSVTPLL